MLRKFRYPILLTIIVTSSMIAYLNLSSIDVREPDAQVSRTTVKTSIVGQIPSGNRQTRCGYSNGSGGYTPYEPSVSCDVSWCRTCVYSANGQWYKE
ncbi:MAG: hypothetical protein KBD63_02170 [Bacteriovoracaceae bacterium]|nr:hypothetical protein [Bacteriovoracaceae bacterium]